jgi:hypothetical protein
MRVFLPAGGESGWSAKAGNTVDSSLRGVQKIRRYSSLFVAIRRFDSSQKIRRSKVF